MDCAKCSSCDRVVTEGVHCNACNTDLHYECAGITEGGYRKLGTERKSNWRCQKCKIGGQPLLKTGESNPNPLPTSPTSENSSAMIQLLTEMKTLTAKVSVLGSLPDDMKALKDQFVSLQEVVKLANASIAEFNIKIKKLEERMSQLENAKNDQVIAIQTRMDMIEDNLNEKEQWSRMSNVEIKGVPQSKTENLFDIVDKLGKKIQYPIQKTYLNFVTRVPTKNTEHTKPIIVCFNNRYAKEDFIAAARLYMKNEPLTALDLGLSVDDRIYVNDHLTTRNKTLLTKAKKLKQEKGFQYLWVKHCKIFLRKTDTSPIINIKAEKDLNKLST